MVSSGRPKLLSISVVGLALIAVGGSIAKVRSDVKRDKESSENFAIIFSPAKGWSELQHGPQTLFLFQHPENKVLLRGAVSQVIAEYNPTPELDTEGIAQYYIDRTKENMPGWSATKLDKVSANNTEFRLIHREKTDKTVVTAYAVKGNTTLMITLSGNLKEKEAVETMLPYFREYVSSIELRPEDMNDL